MRFISKSALIVLMKSLCSLESGQARGYVDVQQGSLMLTQDTTGLYFAVSSPKVPIVVRDNVNNLCEEKTRLAKDQSQIEVFEAGTGNLALTLDMRMPIKDFCWSPCGRYISVCGTRNTASSRLSVLPRQMQESILNMLDAVRHDKHFWSKFTIDLESINVKT